MNILPSDEVVKSIIEPQITVPNDNNRIYTMESVNSEANYSTNYLFWHYHQTKPEEFYSKILLFFLSLAFLSSSFCSIKVSLLEIFTQPIHGWVDSRGIVTSRERLAHYLICRLAGVSLRLESVSRPTGFRQRVQI